MNIVLGAESVNGLRRLGRGEGLMGRVRLRERVGGRVVRKEAAGVRRSMLRTLVAVIIRKSDCGLSGKALRPFYVPEESH